MNSSQVIQGMVFKREVEGNITKVEDAKIVVFSCPLDSMATETKVLCIDYVLTIVSFTEMTSRRETDVYMLITSGNSSYKERC